MKVIYVLYTCRDIIYTPYAPEHIHLSTPMVSIKSAHKNLLWPIKYHNPIEQFCTINSSVEGLLIVGITGLWQVRFLEHCQNQDRKS